MHWIISSVYFLWFTEIKKDETAGARNAHWEVRNTYTWNEEGHSEDIGIDRRIILNRILLKSSWKVWIGLIWLNIGTDDGPYEHGNKTLGSVEDRNFLEEFVVLSDCEKGLAPWKWIV